MLDDLSVTSCKELLFEIWVLIELESKTSVHDFFLNFIPIFSKWELSGLTHFESIVGLGGFDNFEFVWVTFEFFGLEIVFGSGVNNTILLELSWVEVRKEAMGSIFSVKLDGALILLIHAGYVLIC